MSKPFPKQCEVPGCESADVALVVTAYEWRCHSHSGGNATPHPENTPVGRLVAENADLRAALAAAEAELADERRHADALAGLLANAAMFMDIPRWARTNLAGEDANIEVANFYATKRSVEAVEAEHRARRAAGVAK